MARDTAPHAKRVRRLGVGGHVEAGYVSERAEPRLGEVLRRARKYRGYSLRQVQERTGILNAHLSQIERGHIRRPIPRFCGDLASCTPLTTISWLSGRGIVKTSTEAPHV